MSLDHHQWHLCMVDRKLIKIAAEWEQTCLIYISFIHQRPHCCWAVLQLRAKKKQKPATALQKHDMDQNPQQDFVHHVCQLSITQEITWLSLCSGTPTDLLRVVAGEGNMPASRFRMCLCWGTSWAASINKNDQLFSQFIILSIKCQ